MRKLAVIYLFLFASVFVSWQCLATSVTLTGAGAPPSAGGGYQGPGDIVSGHDGFWYGADTCYSSTYSGPTVDIVNSTGTVGTRRICTAGVVSDLVSSSACTFVTGNACSPLTSTCGSCGVTKVYDQTTGNICGGAPCHVAQAAFSVMPLYTANAVGSKHCLQGSSANSTSLQSAGFSAAINQAYGFVAVTERTTTGTPTIAGPILTAINMRTSFSGTTANTFLANAGAAAAVTATDAAPHAIQVNFNDGAFNQGSVAQVGNVFTGPTGPPNGLTTGPNGPAVGQVVTLLNDGGGTNFLTGYVCEVGIFQTDITASMATLYANMQTRYPGGGL